MPARLPLSVSVLSAAAALAVVGYLTLGSETPSTSAGPTGPAPACQPADLDTSAALAGGAVTVSPAPGSMDASYRSQISLLGVPVGELSDISVVGSRSGRHSGRLEAYSQGDGASFLPAKPFTQGEKVSVHAVLAQGASRTPFAWQFTVAEVDSTSKSLETPPPPAPKPKPSEYQVFLSEPGLEPPKVTVTTDTHRQGAGDLLLAPYAGSGQYGPMILDGNGRLIWFKRLPAGARAADVRVQEYEGRPVITWWQDPLVAGGQHDSGLEIANTSYQAVKIVRGGNGYQPDLHAFEITPQGTALFTVYDAIRCNLHHYRGPSDGAVADTLFQEVDLKTGLVRFEWHSLDHVALADSYEPVRPGGSPSSPWDDFHINAVSEHGSHFLVDSRNTWAAYWVDAQTGQITWRVGGKQSSFKLGPGAAPAWQHDARLDPDGTVSFFDNGGTPKVHSQSRGLVISLDSQDATASLVKGFPHPSPPLLAASQGDFQPQPEGEWVAGWGQEPYFTEFSATGQVLFDAHLPTRYQSYTVLRFPWAATPSQPPQLAVRPGPHGGLVAYASWNGATAVTGWRVLGGSTAASMKPLASAPSSGFESRIALSSSPSHLSVQALSSDGAVLGTSATVTP
jgi:hypothetical protein